MSKQQYEDEILKQKAEKEEIRRKFQEIRSKIMETIKDRKQFEKDYLEIIKKQKRYWEDQLGNIDPEKDKNRYRELKENIRREKSLIIKIKEELNRIDEEFKMEMKHKQMEKEIENKD